MFVFTLTEYLVTLKVLVFTLKVLVFTLKVLVFALKVLVFTLKATHFDLSYLPRHILELLRRFDSEAGEAGELEARETGDEHKRDHGKEKEERRNASRILSPSLHPLRAHPFGSDRDVWERARSEPILKWKLSGSARQSEIGILCFDWLIHPGV